LCSSVIVRGNALKDEALESHQPAAYTITDLALGLIERRVIGLNGGEEIA
jgi:hypothetical protein